ncbi:MAG TPA: hypothetical protein VGM75_24390 [Pseudonocardiaceae bacterium]|jgi:hypothetical protein
MSSDNSGGGTPSAPKQVESITDVQAQVASAEQKLVNARSSLPSWLNPPSVDAGIEASLKRAGDYVTQDQYQQLLAADLETQAAPGFAGHNYSAYTATQLKQMVTTNMDPTTAGSAASTWTDLGNKYVTVAQDLGQSASGSEYGWQGAAGDSARNFINGVAKWTGTAGQGAQLAGNRLGVQSEAASAAKNSMPTNPTEPPTAADVSATMLQSGFSPIAGAAKLNAQFQQAAADHVEAVQAAQIYDTSLANSGEKFPAFNAPPTFSSGSGGGAVLPSSGEGGVSGLGSSGNAPRANASVRSGSSVGAGGGVPGGVRQVPVTPASRAGTPNVSTGQSGFDSGSNVNTNPGVNAPSQGTGGNLGGSSADPTFSGSLLGELGGAGGAGGLGSGVGGLRGLAGGAGAGARGVGAGEGAAGGSGARSGIGAGAVAEEAGGGVGVRGGAAGEPGQAGMMPRGGKGKGGEDGEHKRPAYLLDPDPEATFGSDEHVVPPVIGE